MILPLFYSTTTAVNGERMKVDIPFNEFSPTQQEKIISKCMEFDQAGSLDILKYEQPDVWLMCMPLIIDEKTK